MSWRHRWHRHRRVQAPRLGTLVLVGGFLALACGFGELQEFSLWDPAYYLGSAASLVEDGDLDLRNDLLFAEASPELLLQALCYTTPEGHLRNDFPIGPGLFWAPIYLAGRPLDGLPAAGGVGGGRWSEGRLLLALLAGLTVAALLIEALRRWIRQLGVSGWAGILAVGALFLGTPLGLYSLRLYTMAHALAALAALGLVFATLGLVAEPGRGRAVILGAAFGSCVLLRWQDAVLGLIPLGGLVMVWRAPGPPGRRLWTAVLAAAAAGWMVAAQLSAWHLEGRRIGGIPQGDGFMRWASPHLSELLLSPLAGAGPWAPVLLLGLVGLLLPWRLPLPACWRWIFLAVFLAGFYISAAAGDWWGGAAYGPRRLTSLVPLAAAGLANGWRWVRPGWPRSLAALLLAGCCAWGLVTMHLFLAEVRDLSILFTGRPSSAAAAAQVEAIQDRGLAVEALAGLPEHFVRSVRGGNGGVFVLAALAAFGMAAGAVRLVPRRHLEVAAAAAALSLASGLHLLSLLNLGAGPPPSRTWNLSCAAATGVSDRVVRPPVPEPAAADGVSWLTSVALWRQGRGGEAQLLVAGLRGRGYPVVDAQLRDLEAGSRKGDVLGAWIPVVDPARAPMPGLEAWAARLPEAAATVLEFDLQGPKGAVLTSGEILRILQGTQPVARLRISGSLGVLEGTGRSAAKVEPIDGRLRSEVRLLPTGEIEADLNGVRLSTSLYAGSPEQGPGGLSVRFGAGGANRRRKLPRGFALKDVRVLALPEPRCATERCRWGAVSQHPELSSAPEGFYNG